MGIIKCPKCKKEISDKAEKCVHCGYELIKKSIGQCPECGSDINENDSICSKCGCPINNGMPIASVNVKSRSGKSKKIIIAIILILSIMAGGFFTYKYYKSSAEKYDLIMHGDQYKTDYGSATYKMLNGAAKAETCVNKITKVWSNSIWKTSDKETDKYTKKNGKFNSDFNDSLTALFADSEFIETVDDVKNNKNEVNKIMKSLKNPPEDWKDAYDDLKMLYNEYLNLTNLCINPTGSLQTYSTNVGNADTNTINWYEKVKTYLE